MAGSVRGARTPELQGVEVLRADRALDRVACDSSISVILALISLRTRVSGKGLSGEKWSALLVWS
jgi:hypothetical protein